MVIYIGVTLALTVNWTQPRTTWDRKLNWRIALTRFVCVRLSWLSIEVERLRSWWVEPFHGQVALGCRSKLAMFEWMSIQYYSIVLKSHTRSFTDFPQWRTWKFMGDKFFHLPSWFWSEWLFFSTAAKIKLEHLSIWYSIILTFLTFIKNIMISYILSIQGKRVYNMEDMTSCIVDA